MVEEVARLVGLDRLPAVATVPVALAPVPEDPTFGLLDRMRRRAAALGFHDLATNSLVSAATAAAYADPAWTGHARATVETLNPVSQDMAVAAPEPAARPRAGRRPTTPPAEPTRSASSTSATSTPARSRGEATVVDGYRRDAAASRSR